MKQLICTSNAPLPGNEYAPPLEVGKIYDLKQVVTDKLGNPHYDVGLISKLEYVRSYETKEIIKPSGVGSPHWCHPSRFEEVSNV